MNLIGLVGKAGSGKDTVADILVRDHRWVKVALADPMKRACAEWFDWSADTLWGPSSARNEPHARLGGLSARKALQLLGTEFGRACYPDVWLEYALRIADELLASKEWRAVYSAERGLTRLYDTDALRYGTASGVVISDVRFPNECAAIHAKGGSIWKTTHGGGLEGAAGTHVSESHIDTLEVDHTIPDGGLDALPLLITTLLHGDR